MFNSVHSPLVNTRPINYYSWSVDCLYFGRLTTSQINAYCIYFPKSCISGPVYQQIVEVFYFSGEDICGWMPAGPGEFSNFLWLHESRRLMSCVWHYVACILSYQPPPTFTPVVIDFLLMLSLYLSFSPLRFVSSHDKVLRVQLAEAPAWVHAGRHLLRQVWWGKNNAFLQRVPNKLMNKMEQLVM